MQVPLGIFSTTSIVFWRAVCKYAVSNGGAAISHLGTSREDGLVKLRLPRLRHYQGWQHQHPHFRVFWHRSDYRHCLHCSFLRPLSLKSIPRVGQTIKCCFTDLPAGDIQPYQGYITFSTIMPPKGNPQRLLQFASRRKLSPLIESQKRDWHSNVEFLWK